MVVRSFSTPGVKSSFDDFTVEVVAIRQSDPSWVISVVEEAAFPALRKIQLTPIFAIYSSKFSLSKILSKFI